MCLFTDMPWRRDICVFIWENHYLISEVDAQLTEMEKAACFNNTLMTALKCNWCQCTSVESGGNWKRTSTIFKHKNEMKVNYTLLGWSKQLCFIDKVLRRVSFQWMYKNHPLIILIWYIMTSSTSLFTVRGIHYCYCCWDLGQK